MLETQTSTSPSDSIRLEQSWKEQLLDEFQKPYMKELKAFLQKELQAKKIIYPRNQDIFAAFDATPFDKTRVVIIGQDPYHGPGQAHGLCFSVQKGVPPPPSLKNIYKELEADLNIPQAKHGYLMKWAQQGVLLLNATLTVEASKAGSHHNKGWEQFTDAVIEKLNQKKEKLIFILWGSPAQKKGAIVDPKKHAILKAPHPSPLSAHRGFLGCKHFSKINALLEKNGQTPIDWSLD